MTGTDTHLAREDAETRAETLASATYAQVRRDIVTAVHRPGQKLLLRELCARHGVGLAPVREALNRLTSEELVVQTDQRGFRVSPISLGELEDITETRCLLESICLRDSVTGDDAAWRAAAQSALERLEQLAPVAGPRARPEGNAAWEAAHRDFHRALICGGRSPILRRLCAQLWMRTERYRYLGGVVGPAQPPRGGAEHRTILETALSGAAEEAAELLQAHYRRTMEVIRATLVRDGG